MSTSDKTVELRDDASRTAETASRARPPKRLTPTATTDTESLLVLAPNALVFWSEGQTWVSVAGDEAKVRLDSVSDLAILARFREPTTLSAALTAVDDDATDDGLGGSRESFEESIRALREAGVLLTVDTPDAPLLGQVREGAPRMQQAMRWWERHDQLFHAESRRGAGGTWRLAGRIEPAPAVKPPLAGASVVALMPDPPVPEIGLADVLSMRRSVREYGAAPIPFEVFSAFFWLTSKNRHPAVRSNVIPDEYVDRPYPSGGACYPLEVYPVLSEQAVAGVDRGVYHYCPERHVLERIAVPERSLLRIFKSAQHTMGEVGKNEIKAPPVVLLLTARFHRLCYKYQGLAYALLLKEVGAFYQTCYLAATLLDLAPCALGKVTTDALFVADANLRDDGEVPVGEMALGAKRI